MNEHDGLPPADGLLPPLPVAMVHSFGVDNQVDFEIDFYRSLLERDPNYVEVLKVLASNLTSKRRFSEGLEIDQRIVRLRPADPVAFYNLACTLSLSGQVDASLETLERALAMGYDEFDFLTHDPDLDAARRTPRFKKLLAQYLVG